MDWSNVRSCFLKRAHAGSGTYAAGKAGSGNKPKPVRFLWPQSAHFYESHESTVPSAFTLKIADFL